MKIGIDKIGFATAQYVLNMDDLAESRYVDPDKYSKGLLLNNLSITPVNDDIVTLGASAAESILSEEDKNTIDMMTKVKLLLLIFTVSWASNLLLVALK